MAIRYFGKKAIFFSLLSVFILLAFLILFSSLFEPKTFLVQQDVEDELVLLSNDQLTFFKDSYFQNVIKTSARIALISYIDTINNGGFRIDCQSDNNCDEDATELADLEDELVNMIVVGNPEGDIGNPKKGRFMLPEYSHLPLLDQLNEMRKIYRDHFQVELNFLDVDGNMWPIDPVTDDFDAGIVDQAFVQKNVLDEMHIGQIRPYSMQVNLTIGFNYSAKQNSIRWVFDTFNLSVEVPINGLIDPVYMYYTKNLFGSAHQYNNTFKENIVYGSNDPNTFLTMYNTSNYMSAPDHAPSFIQRLVNSNRTSHCCGISSVVNLYTIYGGTINDATLQTDISDWYKRSSIDTLFFHGINNFICAETVTDPELQLYWVSDLERVGVGNSHFALDLYHTNLFHIPEMFYNDDTDPLDDQYNNVDYCEESPACAGACP